MSSEQKLSGQRFLGLLRPIERDLEAYCRRLAFDAADVPDAIQNAVLRAFRAFDHYHDENPEARQAYETLVKHLPEDQREKAMVSIARQTMRMTARQQGQRQAPAVGVAA